MYLYVFLQLCLHMCFIFGGFCTHIALNRFHLWRCLLVVLRCQCLRRCVSSSSVRALTVRWRLNVLVKKKKKEKCCFSICCICLNQGLMKRWISFKTFAQYFFKWTLKFLINESNCLFVCFSLAFVMEVRDRAEKK